MTTPQMSRFKKPLLTLAAACSAAVIVAGCSGADGQPTLAPAGSTANDAPLPQRTEFTGANVYIGGTDADATVSNFAGFLSSNAIPASETTMGDGFDEGVAIDALSDKLFRAGTSGANGAVRLTCDAAFAASSFAPAMGDPQLNREITLGGAGATPKGIALADQAGLIFVASNDVSVVDVYSQAAGGTAAPVDTFVTTATPWDLVYDAATDRLFTANTDGSVDYFAGAVAAVAAGTAGAPTSTFTNANAVNSHGIVYLPGDLLIVSDVGMAGSDTDGAIFYYAGASNLAGTVVPARSIAGPATTLGNPVDLQAFGSTLLVAEKANNGGAILEYSTSASGASGDVAPVNSVAFSAPESMFYKSPRIAPSVADATDFAGTPAALLATAGNTVRFLELDLSAEQQAAFTLPATSTAQNINYNQEGDAYITFDDAAGDGVLVASRILGRDGETASVGVLDRSIILPTQATAAPKGLEVTIGNNLMLVADFGNNTILGYGLCQDGTVAPLFTVDVSATPGFSGSIWDMDYDAGADALYVAGTNGQIVVFADNPATTGTGNDEGFLAQALGDSATASASFLFTITPTSGGAAFGNMHGILVDGSTAIVTDVGSPPAGNPGQISVVTLSLAAVDADNNSLDEDAATATVIDRTFVPEFTIADGMTDLDNPVDIATAPNPDDSTAVDLYVADKAEGQVYLFSDILSLDPTPPNADTGAANRGDVSSTIAPSAMFALPAVESLAVISDGAGSGF